MYIDKKFLAEMALQYGFVRDTLEKVLRLTEILKYINSNPAMENRLALKGGTAINLTVFQLPRLSVDIDLDYCDDADRAGMFAFREQITKDLVKYMTTEGYTLEPKSRENHSLSSMIFSYLNSAGCKDNIKIEINYSMRCHILPLEHKKIETIGVPGELSVLTLTNAELFGSKIKALFDRTAPRDLYDLDNMIKNRLFNEPEERDLLKKCVLFYMAVGNKEVPERIDYSALDQITWYRIKTELLPVKKKQEKFDLEETKQRVKGFLQEIMQMTEKERQFMESFREGEYRPELLFDDSAILERIEKHPMAMWKSNI